MSNEVKVGAFTVVGLALLAAMLIGLSGVSFFGPRQYTLYATFPEVVGLNPAAEVRFAGVLAGKVNNVETEGMHVLVTMSVNSDLRIPTRRRSRSAPAASSARNTSTSFRRGTSASISNPTTAWPARRRRAWSR